MKKSHLVVVQSHPGPGLVIIRPLLVISLRRLIPLWPAAVPEDELVAVAVAVPIAEVEQPPPEVEEERV